MAEQSAVLHGFWDTYNIRCGKHVAMAVVLELHTCHNAHASTVVLAGEPLLTFCWSVQAILEDLSQTSKIPSEKLKRQPVLVGASGIAAIAGLTAVVAASVQAIS